MLRRALRQLISFVFGIVLMVTVVIGAYKSTQKSLEFPTATDITAIDNVGTLLSHTERKAIIRSRGSSVQVMSMSLAIFCPYGQSRSGRALCVYSNCSGREFIRV